MASVHVTTSSTSATTRDTHIQATRCQATPVTTAPVKARRAVSVGEGPEAPPPHAPGLRHGYNGTAAVGGGLAAAQTAPHRVTTGRSSPTTGVR